MISDVGSSIRLILNENNGIENSRINELQIEFTFILDVTCHYLHNRWFQICQMQTNLQPFQKLI